MLCCLKELVCILLLPLLVKPADAINLKECVFHVKEGFVVSRMGY